MLSATDPVATLSVLSSLSGLRDPNLYNVIFGESVFNDAVAIVLFDVFSRVSEDDTQGEGQGGQGWLQVLGATGKFLYVTLLSGLIGISIGIIAALLTRWWWIRGIPHVEATALAALAYVSYVAAEVTQASGIMSLFVCSMMLSHYSRHNITRTAATVTTTGFHALAFVAEAAVFTFLGADFVLSDFGGSALDPETEGGQWDSRLLGITIPLVLVARIFSIVPLCALINSFRRRAGASDTVIGWRSQLVLWWAGLRGAIAYGLAKRWDSEQSREDGAEQLNEPVGQVTTTITIVIFTTFCLGSTISLVRNLLLSWCIGRTAAPATRGY